MNIILFEPVEVDQPLSLKDERVKHIQRILKLEPGDRFVAGIINGKAGWGELISFRNNQMNWAFSPDPTQEEHCRQYPVTLIVGHPRPPVARRILKDSTTMGVQRIFMTGTDLGEKSYIQSKLWRDELFYSSLLEGAQQGRTTLLPDARPFFTLKRALEELEPHGFRIALDHISPEGPLVSAEIPAEVPLVLAVGPERGWTEKERELLIEQGFRLFSLGPRILRTETAVSAGLMTMMCSAGRW